MRDRRFIVALVVFAVIAGAVALFLGKPDKHAPTGASSPPPEEVAAAQQETPPSESAEAPAAPSGQPSAIAPRAAGDRASTLRDALSRMDDDAARIAAIESAMDDGAVETLPVLEGVELRSDPEAAPTIIHAIAMLGRKAGRADERQAAQTLGNWIHAESKREGADARGNVSVLVDALGDLGNHDAAQALAGSLDNDSLPLHVQTLAVQRLTALGDPSAQDAIAHFSARVAALPHAEGLDESLREEAVAVAATASDRFHL